MNPPAAAIPTVLVARLQALVEALALPVDLVVSPYLRSCWA